MFVVHHRHTDRSLVVTVVINIDKMNQFVLLVLLSLLHCSFNS